jgi:hypothetical protein
MIIHFINNELKIYKINNVGYYTCYNRKEVNKIVIDIINKCNINPSERLFSSLSKQFQIDEISIKEAKSIIFWDHPGVSLYDLYRDNKKSIGKE